jgi:hypothetical protein
MVKEGSRRTVVESDTSGLSGTGILEADSINFYTSNS